MMEPKGRGAASDGGKGGGRGLGGERKSTVIESVLVANRGEIARRVIRTVRRMGIRAIAVYSEADASLPYVREADEAVPIGPAPAASSYLDADGLLEAARRTRAVAIH